MVCGADFGKHCCRSFCNISIFKWKTLFSRLTNGREISLVRFRRKSDLGKSFTVSDKFEIQSYLWYIHEHGQKLWGVQFLKNFRGRVIKISNFFSQICDNHRGYENQLQNLMKNFQKYWKKFKFLWNIIKILLFYPQSLQFSQKFWQEQLWKFLPAAPPKFLRGSPFWNFQGGVAFKPPPPVLMYALVQWLPKLWGHCWKAVVVQRDPVMMIVVDRWSLNQIFSRKV